jgi:hypothetical protein
VHSSTSSQAHIERANVATERDEIPAALLPVGGRLYNVLPPAGESHVSATGRLTEVLAIAAFLTAGCGANGEAPSTVVTSVTPPAEVTTTDRVARTTLAASKSTTSTSPPPITTRCVDINMTETIVPLPSDIPAFAGEEMGLFFKETVDGTLVRRVEYGQIANPEDVEWVPYSLVADATLFETHAKLVFNHRRVDYLQLAFLGYGADEVVMDGWEDEPALRAAWDGELITFADGTTLPFVIQFPSSRYEWPTDERRGT